MKPVAILFIFLLLIAWIVQTPSVPSSESDLKEGAVALRSLQASIADLQRTIDETRTAVRDLQKQVQDESTGPAIIDQLVDRAAAAFEQNDADQGYAVLSIALAKSPASTTALDLLEKALTNQSSGRAVGESAERVAVMADAIRAGLVAAKSLGEVDDLLERERRLMEAWKTQAVPVAESQPASVAPVTFEAQIADLKAQAGSADAIMLRELHIRCERLHAEIVESALDNEADPASHDRVLAECRDLLDDMDLRLADHSIRRSRAEADEQTRQAIQRAQELLADVTKQRGEIQNSAARPAGAFQGLGSRLAEAELALSGVSPLCSEKLRAESVTTMNAIRKEAVTTRALQQSSYNTWAISQIKAASTAYSSGKGWLDDDEDGFLLTLKNQFGPVDPHLLHSSVVVLHGEIYQKLIAELSADQKIHATEVVEASTKLQLSDF